MADRYLDLAPGDRREVLAVAADTSGRPIHLLEKDIWVVWALSVLFDSPLGASLVFKGGTSLSKVYDAIRRFSEDVDLTYDVRQLIPELAGQGPKGGTDALPSTQSQERKWSKAVRDRLPIWVAEEAAPLLQAALEQVEPGGEVRIEGTELFIRYAPVGSTSDYVRPEVKLEFGARATGEPNESRNIGCDATTHVDAVTFPTARPRVMLVERTFWEKATAAHVFCRQGRLRGERFARHWYDLHRLDAVGYADAALTRRDIATAVADHKAMFFREKDAEGDQVDYRAAVAGDLQLVPGTDGMAVLAEDYGKMISDGLFLDEPEPFERVMDGLAALQERVNLAASDAATVSTQESS